MAEGHNSIAGDELKRYIERIERLREQQKALKEDEKEVFAEAKGRGFDVKIMRQVIKRRARNKDDIDEEETLIELYERALGQLKDTPLGQAAMARANG
jgi:uncharacterized protein (UPF0335 family)